jgi:hypothetical protein
MMPDKIGTAAEEDLLAKLRDHAWDYFELHAEQRLKTFHFYILLETGLVAAMLVAARMGTPEPRFLVIVGIAMIFFSFVFWKLDFRTKGMIKMSEEALKLYERRKFGTDEEMSKSVPFTNDPQARGLIGVSPLGILSYSKCFGAVFIAFAVLGTIVSGAALDAMRGYHSVQVRR